LQTETDLQEHTAGELRKVHIDKTFLRVELTKAESIIANGQADLLELQRTIEAKDGEIATLAEEADAADKREQALEEDKRAMQSKLEMAEGNARKLKREIDSFQTDLLELQRTVETKNGEIETLAGEADAADKREQALEEDKHAMRSELEMADGNARKLQREIDFCGRQVKAAHVVHFNILTLFDAVLTLLYRHSGGGCQRA